MDTGRWHADPLYEDGEDEAQWLLDREDGSVTRLFTYGTGVWNVQSRDYEAADIPADDFDAAARIVRAHQEKADERA